MPVCRTFRVPAGTAVAGEVATRATNVPLPTTSAAAAINRPSRLPSRLKDRAITSSPTTIVRRRCICRRLPGIIYGPTRVFLVFFLLATRFAVGLNRPPSTGRANRPKGFSHRSLREANPTFESALRSVPVVEATRGSSRPEGGGAGLCLQERSSADERVGERADPGQPGGQVLGEMMAGGQDIRAGEADLGLTVVVPDQNFKGQIESGQG